MTPAEEKKLLAWAARKRAEERSDAVVAIIALLVIAACWLL